MRKLNELRKTSRSHTNLRGTAKRALVDWIPLDCLLLRRERRVLVMRVEFLRCGAVGENVESVGPGDHAPRLGPRDGMPHCMPSERAFPGNYGFCWKRVVKSRPPRITRMTSMPFARRPIEQHIPPHGEATECVSEFVTSLAQLGKAGQQPALLLQGIDQSPCRIGTVLGHIPADFREIDSRPRV